MMKEVIEEEMIVKMVDEERDLEVEAGMEI